ncbi:MAG TPA: MarR family transcriptional regulator [Nonomuraea sp.]|nr:MarR family transcriptional regulator [Nonomuraea sp.]
MTATASVPRPLRAADPRLAPWRAFVIAHARVWRRLDDDLRVEHGLSLSEYEALLLLAQSDGRRLRMRVLAEDLQLSKSGVTRLVDRLVDDGLVERGQCTTDARGAEAVLTEAGLNRLRAAAPTHLRGIQAYFLDAIEVMDLAAVERAMRAVGEGLPTGPFARAGRSSATLECAPLETAAQAAHEA